MSRSRKRCDKRPDSNKIRLIAHVEQWSDCAGRAAIAKSAAPLKLAIRFTFRPNGSGRLKLARLAITKSICSYENWPHSHVSPPTPNNNDIRPSVRHNSHVCLSVHMSAILSLASYIGIHVLGLQMYPDLSPIRHLTFLNPVGLIRSLVSPSDSGFTSSGSTRFD